MAFYGHTRALNFCASKTKLRKKEKIFFNKDKSYQDVHLGKNRAHTHTHFLFDPCTLTSVMFRVDIVLFLGLNICINPRPCM